MVGMLQMAVGCFQTSVNVTDTQYVKQGANDVQQVLATRTIQGAVDRSSAKKLENIFGGNVSDGSIMVYTQEELFIDDIYEVGSPQKQSFFTWERIKYRVVGIAPWYEVTGIRIYLAEIHVKQDII